MIYKTQNPILPAVKFLPFILSALCTGCITSTQAPGAMSASKTLTSQNRSAPADQATHLVALLPMRSGYGTADHDAYEARIRSITRDHGMDLDSAYSVKQFLGGSGPSGASTVGIWSLGSAQSLQDVMSDPRYQAQVEYRDRIHDMSNTQMYMVKREFSDAPPSPGHVLLVGVLVMNQGFDFEAHDNYEKNIAPISAKYGMRLYRSYRVMQKLSPSGLDNAVALNIWELPNQEALSQVMSDPDYMANIPARNRIHDMQATTMYFVTPRTAG